MKFQLYSDIHIEGRGYFSVPLLDTDLIVLAGDIDVGLEGLKWAETLTRQHAKPVIYVAGNHEFYRHDFFSLTQQMREYAAHRDNLYFLERNELILNGVRILGTTMWTNYFHEQGDKRRDENIAIMNEALSDHRLIYTDKRWFDAQDAYEEHLKSYAWLSKQLSTPFEGKTVVVTHHAPSFECNHIEYGMNLYSPGFVSNLEELIKLTDVWCYGHTHSNLDITIGQCRLLSNQKGYKREKVFPAFREDLVIEV